jgi:DNA-binding MarR family transcriptional regulator
MADIELTETERKVLSYTARGVAKEQAVSKISDFLGLSANDVMGALNSLKKKSLVVESKGGTSTLSVLTNNPLKVKAAMLDPAITKALTEKERGTKAGALKKKTVLNDRTGEIHEIDRRAKPPADLGFDLE